MPVSADNLLLPERHWHRHIITSAPPTPVVSLYPRIRSPRRSTYELQLLVEGFVHRHGFFTPDERRGSQGHGAREAWTGLNWWRDARTHVIPREKVACTRVSAQQRNAVCMFLSGLFRLRDNITHRRGIESSFWLILGTQSCVTFADTADRRTSTIS